MREGCGEACGEGAVSCRRCQSVGAVRAWCVRSRWLSALARAFTHQKVRQQRLPLMEEDGVGLAPRERLRRKLGQRRRHRCRLGSSPGPACPQPTREPHEVAEPSVHRIPGTSVGVRWVRLGWVKRLGWLRVEVGSWSCVLAKGRRGEVGEWSRYVAYSSVLDSGDTMTW